MRACIRCITELVVGVNWTKGSKAQSRYVCTECYNREQKAFNKAWRERNRQKAIEDYQKWKAENPQKYADQLARKRKKK